jgi:DNA-binding IclR family transcriptional regulator
VIEQPRDLVRALQRGLMLLEALGMEAEGMPAKDVSARTGLNVSTCYHLLNTLVASGYATKSPDRSFRLSDKVCFPLAASLGDDFVAEVLQEHLYSLAVETSMKAYLTLRHENEIRILEVIEPESRGRKAVRGSHCGPEPYALPLGKAILAYMPADQVTSILERHGIDMIPGPGAPRGRRLMDELNRISRTGVALDREDSVAGLCWVAVPLADSSSRVIGSMAISVPADRYYANENELVLRTIKKANAANRAIGITQLTVSY